MKSIDFPEANLPLAANQPEYKTLYVWVGPKPQFIMACQYELTDEEVADIVKTKRIFYSQSTFGHGFHPMQIFTKSPFIDPIITDKKPLDENRTPAEEWDKLHYMDSNTTGVHEGLGPCINCNKPFEHHFWSSRKCEL